jgi:excisionase family DNA binding protein
MAQGLNQPGGGAGVAGAAAQLGVGLQMGQQMMQQTANTMAGASTPPAAAGSSMAATPGSLPDVLTPADAAKALGVSEADVVATLESGDLKGKKIGASWRITRDALSSYLKS